MSDKLVEYFEADYILMVNVDRTVAEAARQIMIVGHSKIKPPDAVHLATAIASPGVEETHTFDQRLLALNGKLDTATGGKLKICKLDAGAPPAPLLEAIDAAEAKAPSLEEKP